MGNVCIRILMKYETTTPRDGQDLVVRALEVNC